MFPGKLKFCLVIFIVFILASCNLISFETLDIEYNISSCNGYNFILEPLKLKFSLFLDELSVEEVFVLQKNGSTIECEFFWNENSLLVIPKEGWNSGGFYSLTFSGNIKNIEQKEFTVSEYKFFYYGRFEECPRLENFPSCDLEEKDEALIFTFSKPIERNSFLENFSLSPYYETDTEFSEDFKTVKVIPKSEWKYNSIVCWKISKGVKSLDGYLLDKDYTLTLFTLKNTDIPGIKEICSAFYEEGKLYALNGTCVEKLLYDIPFAIVFSESMDKDSVFSCLTVKPSISYYLLPQDSLCTTFFFVPEENYALNTEYHFTISNSATDLDGMPTYTNYDFFISTSEYYLEVKEIWFNGVQVTGDSDLTEVYLEDENLYVEFYFSEEIDAESKTVFEEALSCNLIFPSVSNAPSLSAIWWNESGSIANVLWTNLSSSEDFNVVYEVFVSGGKNGFVNGSGNYMEDDVCITFIAM